MSTNSVVSVLGEEQARLQTEEVRRAEEARLEAERAEEQKNAPSPAIVAPSVRRAARNFSTSVCKGIDGEESVRFIRPRSNVAAAISMRA